MIFTRKQFVIVVSSLLFLSAFPRACPAAARVPAAPVNIALGRPATFSAPPNYSLCTDPDDATQITDGLYSSQGHLRTVDGTTHLWVQPGTVGWMYLPSNTVTITIDLGSVQPISGVSYSTAAGAAGVSWPTDIEMAVSDDDSTWRGAGNLIELSHGNGLPPARGYGDFRYISHDLHTKGRYIAIAVVGSPFVFVDEIEVYKGNDSWTAQPAPGPIIPDIKAFPSRTDRVVSCAQIRLNHDLAAVANELPAANLPPARKQALSRRLEADDWAAGQINALPVDFKAIVPINPIDSDILAVHGELLAARGLKPLTVWKAHRYAWLPLLAEPSTAPSPRLDISMLGNQYRSDDLLLTNATGQPQRVALRLRGAPAEARDGWLSVYSVAWSDTQQGIPVADALLPLEAHNGVYSVEIPAGLTRKLWITVDSSKVPAGTFKINAIVRGEKRQTNVPFRLSISKLRMERPRLSLSMWAYTNGKGYVGVTVRNRSSALALLRSHFVDSPWATDAVLPKPTTRDFDVRGNLLNKLDFLSLDDWIAMWPDARRYFVSAGLGDADSSATVTSFAGAQMGTSEFDARVGGWARAIAEHVKGLGLRPKQLCLLLVDEPGTEAKYATIAGWTRAIAATAPELGIFQDPGYARPDQTKIRDTIEMADVVCPNLAASYLPAGNTVQDYFKGLRTSARALWFYQCAAPVRLFDPQLYYRYAAWEAFEAGATGQAFWAFGDIGNAPSSWSEYAITTPLTYAPVFCDADTVYDSVHWDAVREGIEDYEELAMLRDDIDASHREAWKAHAAELLDTALSAIDKSRPPTNDWDNTIDADLADAQLGRVTQALEQERP